MGFLMGIEDNNLLIYLGSSIALVCLSATVTTSLIQEKVRRILAFSIICFFLGAMAFSHDWVIFLILIMAIAAEFISPRNQCNNSSTETSLSLGLFTSNKIITVPLKIVTFAYLDKQSWIGSGLGLSNALVPVFIQLAVYLMLEDLRYYWIHYLGHQVSFFWRFHKIHHGLSYLSSLNGFRSHPVFNIGQWATQIILAIVLGVSVEVYTISLVIRDIIVDIFDHANIDYPSTSEKFPWWAYVVATPNFHAWHHKIDCHKVANLSTMFPFWDLLFGTFELPQGDPQSWRFGLTEYEDLPRSLYQELVEPFRNLRDGQTQNEYELDSQVTQPTSSS